VCALPGETVFSPDAEATETKRRSGMLHRAIPILLFAMALVFVGTTPVLGDNVKAHEGIVVSASGGKLTMTDKDGKNEHTHVVPADAKISLDGKPSKLEDLQKGFFVKVIMMKKDNKEQLTLIKAKKKT
jgi:hypothetical protein